MDIMWAWALFHMKERMIWAGRVGINEVIGDGIGQTQHFCKYFFCKLREMERERRGRRVR